MSVAEHGPLLGALLLALAGSALAAAGVRAASALAPDGLDRLLAAIVIAAAVACLESFALGLVALGSDPYALSSAAGLTFVAARIALPTPVVGPARELGAWWSGRSAASRAALGSLAGITAAWAGWLVQHPYLGEDGVRYRLPTVIAWISNSSPGSRFAASPEYVTDAYPLGNELLLTWPMAITRSFVAASLLTPLAMVLAGVAGWHALRRLAVPAPVALGAIAAVLLLPLNMSHLNEPNADLPALAWSACCAALCVGAARRPGLLAAAMLAGALAVGAKTTAVVPVAVALATGAFAARGALRPVRGVLVSAGCAALVLGGFWYARNLVLHGSPLWPFRPAPWGDPAPPLFKALEPSLLDRPKATLQGNVGIYLRQLSGAVALGVLALAMPLVARTRLSLAAAAAAGLALMAYAAAPVTGLGDAGLISYPVLSLRYLLPALGLCAGAVAVTSAGHGRRVRGLVLVVLAGSIAWSVVNDVRLDYPLGPPLATLWPGALAGATGALMATTGRPLPTLAGRLAAPACVVAVAVAVALPADGYVERAAALDAAPFVAVPRFFVSPDAPGPTTPVLFSTTPDARVAGDRLRRPQVLLGAALPCPAYRRGWAVLDNSSGQLNAVSQLHLPVGPLERCAYPDPAVAGVPRQALVYPPLR